MSLEQTTELYADVLRQLLPEGVYDTADSTHVADDIYAHAKALAQVDLNAHRLLEVLEAIPVELLADYEQEYGLPMKCTVPGVLSFTERLQVLKWVRTSRNVMNRVYLEQLLAIFGVTLVDIQKYTPLLCTDSCVSPVDTERSRFKVLLRLQYPMTADMSCIIENYLPDYLRVEWVVDMPWGEWILNPGYSLVGDNIRYTGYKTNQRDYDDSYADFDLVTALVRSFYDSDMQQWQGFVNAANELTGVTDWVLDSANSQIVYTDPNAADINKAYVYANTVQYSSATVKNSDLTLFCKSYIDHYNAVLSANLTFFKTEGIASGASCIAKNENGNQVQLGTHYVLNPNYDPEAAEEQKTLPLETVAQKVISNAASHTNEATQMLAETYIHEVANSIFNEDPAKQFIKLSDLIPQFENNKLFRTQELS